LGKIYDSKECSWWPALPPKKLSKLDQSTIQARIQILDRYLKTLCNHPATAHNPDLILFLSKDYGEKKKKPESETSIDQHSMPSKDSTRNDVLEMLHTLGDKTPNLNQKEDLLSISFQKFLEKPSSLFAISLIGTFFIAKLGLSFAWVILMLPIILYIEEIHRGSSRVDLQACKLGTGRRFTTS
jgi:PX domain.